MLCEQNIEAELSYVYLHAVATRAGFACEIASGHLDGAVRSHAESPGWRRIENVNGKAAVYHRPNDALRQVLVPLDPTFDDYGERIAEAVDSLARFEGRSTRDVRRQLLLPPADLLSLGRVDICFTRA